MDLAAFVAPGADRDRTLSILRRRLDEARAAWPGLAAPGEGFLAFLAGHRPEGRDTAVWLAGTNVPDLYLAHACARGEPAALATLERAFMPRLRAFLVKRFAAAEVADETLQLLRTRLLVAEGGRPPRIASYRGEGELLGWMSTAASRLLMDWHRGRGAEGQEPRSAPPEPTSGDPEVQYLKSRYGAEFRAAFEETLAGLADRDANVLRLYYLEGMTADALAALYQVSSKTIRRWLEATRGKLLAATQRHLGQRLALTTKEVDSVLRLLQSELWVELR